MVLAYHYGYRMSELDWASAAGRRAIGILRHIELRCSQIKERRLALMTCFAYAQSKAANGCGSSSSGVNAAMVAMSKLPPDLIRIIVETICLDKNWHPSLPSVQSKFRPCTSIQGRIYLNEFCFFKGTDIAIEGCQV